MIRPWLCVLTLTLAAPAVWAEGPFKRADLERDLAIEVRLKSPGPFDADFPLRVDLTITNRAKHQSYPVVLPGAGAEDGVTEPYVWFTARVRQAGTTGWRPVEPARPPGMCGMGDWSWHRRVETLAPGASLDVEDHLRPLDLELAFAGTVELTAHYAFLTEREQPRLPGAEGKDEPGPMKGVPAFELTSQPVTFEVTRSLDLQLERGKTRLQRDKAVRLSQVLRATLANRSGAALELERDQYSVWVELRANGRSFHEIERTPVGSNERPERTVADGATVALLGEKGWTDEQLKLTTRPKGGLEARLVLRVAGPQPRTVRSTWLRLD